MEACDPYGIPIELKAQIHLPADVTRKDCSKNLHSEEEHELFPCLLLFRAENLIKVFLDAERSASILITAGMHIHFLLLL